MKKFFLLTVVFLYLFTTSGIAVTVHYCAGKVSSVDFFDTLEKKCDCSKKAIKKNCCQDESKFLKLKDNHFSSSGISISAKDFIKFTLPFSDRTPQQILVQSQEQLFSHHHILSLQNNKIPLYLRNRIFLI